MQTRCVTRLVTRDSKAGTERTAQPSAGAEGGQSKARERVLMHFGGQMSEHEERQDYNSAN